MEILHNFQNRKLFVYKKNTKKIVKMVEEFSE